MDSDQRKTRRLIPTEGRDAAQLHLNGCRHIALMLNVSAEGFRVCTHAGYEVTPGAQGELETCDGKHVVRVAHVAAEADRIYLGLTRLSDVAQSAPAARTRHGASRGGSREPIGVGSILAYAVLPLMIGFAILFAVAGGDGVRGILQMVRRQVGI